MYHTRRCYWRGTPSKEFSDVAVDEELNRDVSDAAIDEEPDSNSGKYVPVTAADEDHDAQEALLLRGTTLYRKSNLCIPGKGIERPQSQIPTCMCLWAIYVFPHCNGDSVYIFLFWE
jgi:hypothetical protein